MAAFFATGHAVDLVLLVIAVEFVVLSWPRSLPLSRARREAAMRPHPPYAKHGEVAAEPTDGPRGSAETASAASSALARGPLPPFGRTPPSTMGEMRRSALIDRLLALLPGVFMLLALRAALIGAAWPWIAAPLAASFPFHLADLARRRL